ncbi:MAG: MFS transporter [Solirubrobacteraceae bacterium]
MLVLSTALCFLAIGSHVAVMPRFVRDELGAGATAVGVAMGATAAVALLLRPWAGALSDRTGRRTPALVGAVVMAAGCALLIPAGSMGLVVLGRMLIGAGEAALTVVTMAWLIDAVPAHRRGRALGTYGMSIWFGIALGPQWSVAILDAWGYGWVWAAGAALALGSGLLLLLLPEPDRAAHAADAAGPAADGATAGAVTGVATGPRPGPGSTDAEPLPGLEQDGIAGAPTIGRGGDGIAGAAVSDAGGAAGRRRGRRLARWWANVPRGALLPGAIFVLAAFGHAVLESFGVLHLSGRGLDPGGGVGGAASVFTVIAVATFLGRALGGRLCDRIGAMPVALAAVVPLGLSYVVFAFASSFGVAVVGALLCGCGLALIYPALSMMVAEAVPAHQRGAGLGLYIGSMDVAFAGGALIGGLVVSVSSTEAAMLGGAVVALLAYPPLLVLGRRGLGRPAVAAVAAD